MNFYDVCCFDKINDTDEDKVNRIMKSILDYGWVGCPILVWGNTLLTGSHRLEALKRIDEEYPGHEILNSCIAEDVTDIVEESIAKFEEEYGWFNIDYSNIGWMLEGSWVEEYKDEIEEW